MVNIVNFNVFFYIQLILSSVFPPCNITFTITTPPPSFDNRNSTSNQTIVLKNLY